MKKILFSIVTMVTLSACNTIKITDTSPVGNEMSSQMKTHIQEQEALITELKLNIAKEECKNACNPSSYSDAQMRMNENDKCIRNLNQLRKSDKCK